MERLSDGQVMVRGCGKCKHNHKFCDNMEDCPTVYEAFEKLMEYQELEEKGFILTPKCLPHDIVWAINLEDNSVTEYEIVSIRYNINSLFHYIWVLRNGASCDLEGFWDGDWGKTVFPTEEARKELAKYGGRLRIELEIPKEYQKDFFNDRFADALNRLKADADTVAGNYEKETATMLVQALKSAEIIHEESE